MHIAVIALCVLLASGTKTGFRTFQPNSARRPSDVLVNAPPPPLIDRIVQGCVAVVNISLSAYLLNLERPRSHLTDL